MPPFDDRRASLGALGLLVTHRHVEAQTARKMFKLGELHPGTGSVERLVALREAGYVEGQNLVIERRHAAGRPERLPALAAELVGLKANVILATGSDAIQAAKNAMSALSSWPPSELIKPRFLVSPER